MDIKEIRYFLMVARESSFTKAAEKLYMTQPALSRKIADLEAELGMSLFRRSGRNIELTPGGVAFQQKAQKLEREYFEILAEMDAMKHGKGMSLRIAYGMAGHISYLSEAILKMKRKNGYLNVSPQRMFNSEIIEGLLRGSIDAGIVNSPELPDDPELAYDIVLPCGLCAFIRRDHPLFNRSSLRMAELAGENYITFEKRTSPLQYDSLLKVCRENGLPVSPIAHAPDTSSFSLLLYLEKAVGIMPYTTAAYQDMDVRRIPIHDTEGFDMVLAWNKKNKNPAIELLRDSF